MVMLHIGLKGMAHAATWWQILSPQTTPSIYVADGGSYYKTQRAQRSRNVTGWDQKFKIQRFQNMIMLHIKLNEIANKCSNTQAHILPLHTPSTPGVWPNAQKKCCCFFLKKVMLHIKLEMNGA